MKTYKHILTCAFMYVSIYVHVHTNTCAYGIYISHSYISVTDYTKTVRFVWGAQI